MKYFDKDHRIGNDACHKNSQLLQSEQIANYHLFNFYKTNLDNPDDCKKQVDKLNDFVSENYMNIKEGYGFTNGCRVDNDSSLRFNESIITNEKGKTQLFARTFKATPDLFRGECEPLLESKLLHGNISSDDKSCLHTTEKPFDIFIPMIDCLSSNVQNPNNIIPGWKWGGEGTRDTIQQKEFLEKNGYVNDGSVWMKKQCDM